jgi:hypothetical protein
MILSDDPCWLRAPLAVARPASSSGWAHGGLRWACLLLGVVAVAVAGCGSGNGLGLVLADPGAYSALHCKQLADTKASLTARQQQLRNLQAKASEGPGGALIGTMSYRTDYELVTNDLKNVEREAKAKNCASLVPTYQSDQTIH